MLAMWGFATLNASPSELTIRAMLRGTMRFRSSNVVRIDPFIGIPLVYWGIRVRHLKKDYPRDIRFTSLTHPRKLLQGLLDSGFTPSGIQKDQCLACGHFLAAEVVTCPKCGWSYDT